MHRSEAYKHHMFLFYVFAILLPFLLTRLSKGLTSVALAVCICSMI